MASSSKGFQSYDVSMSWQLVERDPKKLTYDICLSFAGQQREYVSMMAESLKASGVRIFYDDYEKAALWGKDLYEHLAWVYSSAARYCILFASEDYARKVWTTHERRSAQERALNEHGEYILPVLFDETQIPGLRSTVAYLDARILSPIEIASLAIEKLGPTPREEYLPPEPTRLFRRLKLREGPKRNYAYQVAYSFLRTLKRATPDERRLIGYVFFNACSHDDQLTDPHVVLDVMRRDVGVGVAEIIEVFRGLRSLGFTWSVKEHRNEDGVEETLHVTWNDVIDYKNRKTGAYAEGNSTRVAVAMVLGSLEHYCEEHAESVFSRGSSQLRV
jgi:hypothetical protein